MQTKHARTSIKGLVALLTISFFLLLNFSPLQVNAQWMEKNNGLYGGAVSAIAKEGTNLYAGTYNGVFLSTDNGVSWTAVNTGLTDNLVLALAVSGTDVFAGTAGGGVFLSTNNGTSWTAVNTGLTDTNIEALAVSGTDVFAGTAGGGVFLSTNNGTSWTAVNTGLTETFISALTVSGTDVFAGTDGGVFLSTNNGTSWTAVNTGLTDLFVNALTVSGTDVFAGTDAGGVFLSTDNGTSWAAVNTGLANTIVDALTVSGTNVFAGSYSGVFLSTDNGTSWAEVNTGLTNLDVRALTVSGTDVFAGTDGGGVFLSTDNGTSWTAVNTGLTNLDVRSLTVSGTDVFAGTDGGGVFLSTDNGASWTAVNTGLTNNFVMSLAVSGTDVFAGTDGGGAFLSTDNGTSWTAVNTGLTDQFVQSLTVSGTDVFAGTGGGVFLSTDNGASWTAVNTGLTDLDVTSLIVSGTDVFTGTYGGVFLSTDNGTSWTAVNTGLTNNFVLSLAVSGSGDLFAGTEGSGVWSRPLIEFATGPVFDLESDSLALVNLYDTTDGANWVNNINWKTGPVNSWNGVTVAGNRVTQVDLNSNNLIGTLPSSLGDLDALQVLNLSGNSLSGSIPIEIGNLVSITTLDLSLNGFNGTIPSELGNVGNLLSTLNLSNNQFSGAIPANLSGLIGLTNVNFANNDLTLFPDFGSNWTGLTDLDVSGNLLQFADLEPYELVINFTYDPQQTFGAVNPKELILRIGEPLTLTFPSVSGTGVTYQWQKDAISVGGQTTTALSIPSFAVLDTGTYTLVANHPTLTLLTLTSKPRKVISANETFFQIDNNNAVFGETLSGIAYSQAWADFDQDGDEDLFVGTVNIGGPGTPNKLYQNNGNGTFSPLSVGALTTDLADVRSASWGDINNDGYPDLFVPDLGYRTGAPVPATSVIYVNNKDNTFTSVALPAVTNLNNIESGVFGDYDNDGFIDLAVFGSSAGSPAPLTLFKNNGGLTISVVPNAFNFQLSSLGTISWVDIDADGFLDLFWSETGGRYYFRNNGNGTFTQNTTSPLVTTAIASTRGHSWGDINNDGNIDLVQLGQTNQTTFFVNDGAGSFTVSDDIARTGQDIRARASTLEDIDNDGDLDFLVVPSSNEQQVYLNNGTGNFTLVTTAQQNFYEAYTFGAVSVADFNNDGFSDLLNFTSTTDASGAPIAEIPRAYQNVTNANNWLKVKLSGVTSNKQGIGAKITLVSAGGTRVRTVKSGSGFAAQSSLIAQFGLGTQTAITSVTVNWPSGNTDVILNPSINQLLTITENSTIPEGLNVVTMSENAVDVSWTPYGFANGGQLYLERANVAAGPYLVVGILADTLTKYSDVGLFANTLYYYRLKHVNGLTESAYTNPALTATFSAGAADTWRIKKDFITQQRLTLTDVDVDTQGNRYLSGNFSGTIFIDGDSIPSKGLNDAIVIKLDKNDKTAWVKSFGSTGVDLGNSLSWGSDSALYVAGYYSDSFTVDGVTVTSAVPGTSDGFLARLNPATGAVQWLTAVGAPAGTSLAKVDVDPAGNIFTTGFFNGNFTFGSSSLVGGGPGLFKFGSDGSKILARFGVVSGPSRFVNEFNSLAVKDSSVYVTGQVDGNWTFEGSSMTPSGLRDAVLIRYDLAGNLKWIKTLGGSGEDFGSEVTVDVAGNIFWAGSFGGAQASIDATILTNKGGGADGFVAKLSGLDGSVAWARTFGTADESDASYSIATDGSNVFVGGLMGYGATDVAGTSISNGKILVASFDTAGAVRWVDKSEGTYGIPWGLTYSSTDLGVLMTGSFEFVQRFGTAELTSAGTRNGFLAFHNDSGLAIPATPGAFQAFATFSGPVSVKWAAVPGVASYSLEKADDFNGPYTQIASLPDSVLTYSDPSVSSGATYYYRLRALQGVYSDYTYTEGVFTFSNALADSWDNTKFFKGKGRENFLDVVTDAAGSSYLVGYATDTTTFGTIKVASKGAHDLLAVKLDSLGTPIWAKSFGSTGTDILEGVQIDGQGSVYVTGYYNGAMTVGADSLPALGHREMITIKLNAANGDVIWSKRGGGTGDSGGLSVAVDSVGNVFVVGFFGGSLTHGTTTLTGGGHALLKYDAAGAPLLALQGALVSSQTEFVNQFQRVKVNNAGVYVLGQYSNNWTFGGLPANGVGGTDLFVAHYDLAGTIKWLRTIGGSGNDEARDIALDAAGNVLVLANANSTSIAIDTITVSQGGKTNLIAKLNGSTGQGLWGKTFGTPQGIDYPYKIAADPSGFFVAGAMDIEPTQFGGPVVNGGLLYLASFDTNGTIKWADAGEGELYSWAMNYSDYHNAAVVAGGVHYNAQIGSSKFEGVEERDLFFTMHGQSATPLAPVIKKAVAANTTTAYVEWAPVADASSYLVQAKLSGATAFSNIKVVRSDTLQALVKNLLPDSVYNVRVVAYGKSVSQSATSAAVNVTISCGTLPLTNGDYLVKYGARKRDGVIIPSEESYSAIYSTTPGSYIINGLTGGYYQKYFGSTAVIDTLTRVCNIVSKPSLVDPTGVAASVSAVVYAPDSLWMEYKTVNGDWLSLRFFKTASQVDSTDIAAITKLYDTTGGDTWTNKTNWKSALPVGFWHGIKTSNGRVVEIDLFNNNLIGELPAELFAMDSLRNLNLGFNKLTGSIPTTITGLKAIEALRLNDNLLTGDIPQDIGLLTALKEVDFGRNQFIGGLPESIGNLVNLESILGAAGNQLEGTIPSTIGNLTKLKILALDANKLEGPLPAEIGNMTALRELYLHQNTISGPLPDSIAKLKNLKTLYLANNQLTGSLPAGVGTMDSLRTLIVQQNQFSFVPNLSGLTLDTLNISNNKVGFGSIEPNLGITGFVYAPQGRFGLPLDTLHSAGDPFTFILNMGGATNSYQWFKDSVAISGGTAKDYFIGSTGETDEGKYFARVTNASVPNMTIDTDDYFLKISSRKRDSLALVTIYQGTNGANWLKQTNWLTGNLSTWQGVTVTNNRVTALNLTDNRMEGPMPPAIRDIGELEVLDLSNTAPSFDPLIDNQIRFLPNLQRLVKLSSVNLTRNRLGFVSIEANLLSLGDKFQFSPQRRFGETRYDSIPVGQAHRVAIEVTGLSNTYQWYFNGDSIKGATNRYYIIDNISFEKMGTYYVEVTSPNVPNFSIRNRNQNVVATTSVSGIVTSVADQSPLTSGTAEVYQIQDGPYLLAATAPLAADGSFTASKVVLGDYIVVAKPDVDLYPDALQTYYSSTIDWLQADTLRVRAAVAGLPIALLQVPGSLGGDGVINGVLDSDLPDNELPDEESRILNRKRVGGAGVSVSRSRIRAKDNDEDYELVAYTVTDENGEFSIGTLTDDTYLINIQYPGVPMDQSSDILLVLGSETDFNQVSVEALVTPTGIVVDKVAVKGIPAAYIKDLNIYPNPGEDIINLDYYVRRKLDNMQIRLTDVTGRELMTQDLPYRKGAQRATLDISSLTTGMYILVISDTAGTFTESRRIQKK